MANVFHITAGLPVARDGSEDTGDNVFHVTAGLPPAVAEPWGDWTPSWKFTTVSTGIVLTSPTDDDPSVSQPVTFEWTAQPDHTGSYTLQVTSTSGDYSSPIINVTVDGLSYEDASTLDPNTEYFWRVGA